LIASKLSDEVLTDLLTGYEKALADLGVSPLPIKFLTRNDSDLATQSLNSILADREALESALDAYVDAVCLDGVPTLDAYAFSYARKKVSEAHSSFRAEMIAKGAEYVYENAYYAVLASQIFSFFDRFDENEMYCEKETLAILENALRDGFFDRLYTYATDKGNFDITDLGTTGEEIAKYCEEQA
jgi:hypothetical protein